MPEEEFILLVQACDQFEVVKIDKDFVSAHKDAFAADPIITEDIAILSVVWVVPLYTTICGVCAST